MEGHAASDATWGRVLKLRRRTTHIHHVMRARFVSLCSVVVLAVACHHATHPAPAPALSDVIRQASRFTTPAGAVVAITYATAQRDTAAMRAEAAQVVVGANQLRSRLLLIPCRDAACDIPPSLTAPVAFAFDCAPDGSCRPAKR